MQALKKKNKKGKGRILESLMTIPWVLGYGGGGTLSRLQWTLVDLNGVR